MQIPNTRLLLITDRSQTLTAVEETVAAALDGGCRWISMREKDLPPDEQVALAGKLLSLAKPVGASLTLHGNPDIALQAGADGVHLAAGGNAEQARAVLGKTALIGVSCHTIGEARLAEKQGADYVTLSPVFLTESKPGYGPALGLDGLSKACKDLSVPVVALGGIAAETAKSCLNAGASAVAVMGAVMRSANPTFEVQNLITATST
jgi:thiamine-phosphate pyrophosphorylase